MAELKRLKFGGNYYYFNTPPIHVESISLNKNSITLVGIGQTEQLIATVSPEGAVESKVIWSSSDTSIAFVNDDGLVTSIGAGTATITATVGNLSETCSVSIADKSINYISVGGGASGTSGGALNSGGGGGAVCLGTLYFTESTINITVGCGGIYGNDGYNGVPGTHSQIGNYTETLANGGCGPTPNTGGGMSGSGCEGGAGNTDYAGGGGGGATGNGCSFTNQRLNPGCGGTGLCGYGGGGGSGAKCFEQYRGFGCDGGGDGGYCSTPGTNATNCGGGGGGGGRFTNTPGNGGNGLVEVCYKTDGSCGINCATGGNCCYTCDGYCVHRFTSDGTFCIVS